MLEQIWEHEILEQWLAKDFQFERKCGNVNALK